jgi:hypothetical protein
MDGGRADLTRRQAWILGAAALAVLAFSALRFDGPSRGYWDTYITVPAMFMNGQAVDLHRIDGTPRFEYELKGRIPDDTYDPAPGSYGIASEDQRIGTAIMFAAPFSLLNLAAFRWVFAATWASLFLFGFVACRRLSGGFVAPLASALVLVLNPFSLYLERLNGNLFGLWSLALLWLLLTDERPRWWLAGLLYGLIGGIRNEAIVLAPVVVGVLRWRSGSMRASLAPAATFVAAAALAIAPVLAWNDFAYGAAIIHPSQVERLQGFRPTFPHSFLGATFQFNGLLNVPFHDHLVRTPHFAFPTFLLWPLITVGSLGVALAAVAAIGVAVVLSRRRPEGLALLAWYLLVYLLFAFQENWEELKQTFMALHLLPLAAFLAAGLGWLAEAARDWRRWAVVAAGSAVVAGGVAAARLVDAPADERWYERFPHAAANDSGLAELPEGLRKDWHYFYTRETAAEVARERDAMTTPSPLPRMYRPIHLPDSSTLSRIANEPSTRELRTLAIWSYIYE